jgi:hypothetical protein
MTMELSELTLDNITSEHLTAYLQSLHNSMGGMLELADEWVEMSDSEKLHFRQEFTRLLGVRQILGAAYRTNLLTPTQSKSLTEFDRSLLQHAATIEFMHHVSLRHILHNLFSWGTPLAFERQTLHIETTSTALAELATV